MRIKAKCRNKKLNDNSIEHKLYDMLPVLRQICKLHRAGRYGFDICAQNIAPAGAKGKQKLLPNALYNAPLRPGYSAPEQYFSDRPQGVWTDVYKASALVFLLITGKLPDAAFERQQGEPVFASPVPPRLSAVAKAVEQGLEQDISKRAASLDILCKEIQSLLPYGYDAENSAPAGKTKRLNLLLIAAAAVFCGVWAVSEINYSSALEYAQQGAFDKAACSIGGVPAFYRDAQNLSLYIDAGILQSKGSYDEAELLFKQMGDYRDSALMVSETRYKRALYLLESGSFEQAQAQFTALGDYSDAPKMAKEAAYKRASTLAKAGELFSARSIISAIHPYKDSETLINSINASIYEKALEHYEKREYFSAGQLFTALPGYLQADSYSTVCAALSALKFGHPQLEQLMLCADEIDLSRAFMREDIIGLFLEGTWKDAKGSTLIVAQDKSVTTNLPWKKGICYYFSSAALYIRTSDDKDIKAFEFIYIDKNTISVYCCQNGRTYTLTRQL